MSMSPRKKQKLNELIGKFKQGDKRALARLITMIETDPLLGKEIFKHYKNPLSKSYIIGITGPPGAGKSTSVDTLAKRISEQGKRVGIISVDPSSPYSGGAFLGDRIRMKNSVANNPDLFMRSLASRGISGGLSRAIFDVTLLYEAFGFDTIILETVGAGQSEIDIFKLAYTTIVLSVPGLGDHIQVAKAGIMEIADIQVVNKKDLGGGKLAAAIDLLLDDIYDYMQEPYWRPPVIQTNALTGEGFDEVIEGIWNHKKFQEENGILDKKKDKKLRGKIHDIIYTEIETYINENFMSEAELNGLMDRIGRNKIGLYEAAYDIFMRYKTKDKMIVDDASYDDYFDSI